MIETFYGTGNLGSAQAFFAALVIGLLFGVALERAGFGSSRRLAGIFYFTDMAVVKVMFTAMITAMLGLAYGMALGWITIDQLYLMPTVYGAQIVGGLLFGVGFVMSGWCPGTGAVGLGSGKMDALLFLIGAVLGSVLFNELFPVLKGVYDWGNSGVAFVYQDLDISRAAFAFGFTLVAVGCFWGAEWIERQRQVGGAYFESPFLKTLSLTLVISAGGLFIFSGYSQVSATSEPAAISQTARIAAAETLEVDLLELVERAGDHIDPEELADRLMNGDPALLLVDVRPSEEFQRFHIRGAENIPISELPSALAPYRNKGIVVLYSNGMTHPAQARDALYRMGYRNVYILTDGLSGFVERCLKPVSLRAEPLPAPAVARVNGWRRFFIGAAPVSAAETAGSAEAEGIKLPGLVTTDWLAERLGRPGVKIIDFRSQPEYSTGHIPGSLYLSVESLRGMVTGLPSMLLKAPILALQFSQMGIQPADLVVLVAGDKLQDATLPGLALERLGHQKYAVLDGGFGKWLAEKRPVDTVLPSVSESRYPVSGTADSFTVDAAAVLDHVKNKSAVILDVRPADYFTGKKSDEARAGHIPGAINRPFSEDVVKAEGFTQFKPLTELASAYAALIPSRQATIIVHCRTGHQASQTYFVLRYLLNYERVFWYDAGWTEWAVRPELPVETGVAR